MSCRLTVVDFLISACLIIAVAAEIYFFPEMFSMVSGHAQSAYDNSTNKALGGIIFAFNWLLFLALLPAVNLLAGFVICMNFKVASNDENLGLAAGLCFFACTTAFLMEYHFFGGILWVAGLGLAVTLGLSKRAKSKSVANTH